jgi:hypothetical protein
MKARRLPFVLSLPLVLGLMGCAREDDGTSPTERNQRDVPTRTDDDGTLRGTDDTTPTTPPGDETGIPPVPNETGDPMYRDREFERGGQTGPQQTDPGQTQPGQTTPGGGAND